jgi:hypothetical protein
MPGRLVEQEAEMYEQNSDAQNHCPQGPYKQASTLSAPTAYKEPSIISGTHAAIWS